MPDSETPADDGQQVRDAAHELETALEDPELAEQVRDVLRHLGSAPFDPVGTPDD